MTSSRLLHQRLVSSNCASHLRAAAPREFNLTASLICRRSASASLAPKTSSNSLLRAPKPTQTRQFHATSTCRFLETTGQILTVCLGLAAGWAVLRSVAIGLVRFKVDRLPPPASWLRAAGPEVASTVSAAVTAGFNMAREAPEDRRHSALGEATFSVPYEVASLNPAAKDFRIEDMGAIPPFPTSPRESLDTNAMDADVAGDEPGGALFDPQKDARIFLYFPNGSEKATAAFLAINAEFPIGTPSEAMATAISTHSQPARLIDQAMRAWTVQYAAWQDENPEVIKRLEPVSGKFPVIFCYRDMISGCHYDVASKRFVETDTARIVFGLVEHPTNNLEKP